MPDRLEYCDLAAVRGMVSPPPHNPRLGLAHRFSTRGIKERIATLALGLSSLALALSPIFFLFWLMQPKVLVNPGIGALRVARAASFEPFLQESSQSAEPLRQESPARLARPQYPEAATSAQREPKREPSRLAQRRKTMKRAHGFAAHRRQTQPVSFAVARSWQDDFNARRDEAVR